MIKISIYILLIITLVGCAGMGSFKGKDDGTVVDSRGNIIKLEEGQSAKELFDIANGALVRGQYDLAAENYRKIEANHPFSKYAEQSHMELAFVEYKMKHWDSAIAIIDRFISMNNTSELLPYAYYLRGLVNFNRGKNFFNKVLPHVQIDKDPVNIRTSYEDFKYILKNYKNSTYTKDAVKRMTYLRNTLASYEIHVANFYFKRKAYMAVINRCNYLIEKYPNAPANMEALIFLEKSYKALLMTDHARDLRKIIEENYPNFKSSFFQEKIDNQIKKNILAVSNLGDDIAVKMGFDIREQVVDDFNGVYKVEYFNNDNLVEIPRNIKPQKYTIVHKFNKEKNIVEIDDEGRNFLDYFSSDDHAHLIVKDIIVGENELIVEEKGIELHKDIDSNNDAIELIKN
jgi:outer membrane protein assembly factor BamD|tara:strand:- start:1614 stop:2816 length:1203 start_codon:yes stop_codon:yes gene_type:complete